MIALEIQKKKFANHKATFTDLGNVKILDFKNPASSEYRIRFLFEEDYYRLHISGDLGELIATNYYNMTFEGFKKDYVSDPGYFEEKICCHSRDLYIYDEDKAKEDIIEFFDGEDELYDLAESDYGYFNDRDMTMQCFFRDVLEDFDYKQGLSRDGFKILAQLTTDEYELYGAEFGKTRTGIIELYLLAFEMAVEQLKEDEKK